MLLNYFEHFISFITQSCRVGTFTALQALNFSHLSSCSIASLKEAAYSFHNLLCRLRCLSLHTGVVWIAMIGQAGNYWRPEEAALHFRSQWMELHVLGIGSGISIANYNVKTSRGKMLWVRKREAELLRKVVIWYSYTGRLKAYIVLKISSL